MPLYEYQCTECGNIEEAIQKFSDPPLTACQHCSGKLTKLISQSSFHLKGTGWYVTDYAGNASSDTDGSSETKTATDAASSDSKTASSPSKSDDG